MRLHDESIETFKSFVRQPYAWPGGYPLFAITSDGGCLCHKCAKDNYRIIRESQNTDAHDGWQVECVDVNWEDDAVICDNCNAVIEAAYGDES